MNKRILFVFLVLLVTLLHLSIAEDQLKLPDADDGLISEEAVKCNGKHVDVEHTFSWQDYSVLAAMLIISCGIGVFYGFLDTKQSTSSDDFLTGGGAMGTFPMAMSLAASFITAIELLGNPAEMYSHGSQFWMICISFILVVPLTSKLYLPVFMKLRLTSSYEYLAIRFNATTSLFASGLYALQMILYTSVAVYAPALALSHVTGLNVYIAVTVVYVVCIFYSSQGGMKAVIITDTFQAAVLVGSILVVMYVGEHDVGGSGVVWSANYQTDRLELFKMNPNPTIRHSFWSVVVGGTFYWLTMFCSNQASIQKYLSVQNISQVRSAIWVSCFGLILVYSINFYTGMIMVAEYVTCDPVKTGEIIAKDELLPLYVMSRMSHLKGVPGFFVAGIFAASLGTVASALNSLAAVTVKDFLGDACGIQIPENRGAFYAKIISIAYGGLSFLLVFIIAHLGSVMQVALSFNGMVGGVTLGLFSLGMFFPWANAKGAIFGSTVAMALILWMGLGQQISMMNSDIVETEKLISTTTCPCMNSTDRVDFIPAEENNNDHVFFLYRISFMWYSAIGYLVTVILGLIVSLLTGAENLEDLNEDLLSPPVREILHKLPHRVKEALKIPLKVKQNNCNSVAKGVVNIALDISNEKFTQKMHIEETMVEEKFRKIPPV